MTTFAKLSTTEPKEGKLGMKFVNLTDDNGPHCFKVESPKIIFEPSVYNGTGEEERKNIVMAITEEAAKEIEELENWTRIRVGVTPEKWNSCVKRVNGPQLKAKINMSGQRQCEFAGHNGAKVAPTYLRGRSATAAILVRGVYMQRNAAGLMIDVVALRYGEVEKDGQESYLQMVM